jgi:6-phosphogluconolactonase
MIRYHFLLLCFLLLAVPSYSSAGMYVYVSIAGENKISVFEVTPASGALSHQGDVTVDGSPGSLAIDPQRRFLFAAVRSTGKLASFRIDSATGMLSHLSTSPVEVDPAYVRVEATGKYLLSAYYRAGKVAVHSIDASGMISDEAIQWTDTAEKAHAVVIDNSNRFVFVPHTGPNAIFQFRFSASTGLLSPNSPAKTTTPEKTGPRHGWIHPNGRFAYFDNEQGSSVTAFRFDSESGRIEAFQTSSTLPADFSERNSCADLELTPSGKFLYVSNRGHNSIACFRLDKETGAMSLVDIASTEMTPRSFNVDPSERYLFAAGQGSGNLAAYRIDPNSGQLTRFETYAVGKQPWWVLAMETDE